MALTPEDPELQDAALARMWEEEAVYDLLGVHPARFRDKSFLQNQGDEYPPVLPPAGHLLNVLFETIDPAGSFIEGSNSHLHWYIGGTQRIPQLQISLEDTKLSLNFANSRELYMLSVDLCDPTSLEQVRHYFDVFPSKFRGWGRLPVRLRSVEEAFA
ncbi:MAG: hypothetical protein U0871_07115 [Gemmataceae bacterium]